MRTLSTIQASDLTQLAQNANPFFVLIHQPTVMISVNQITYINTNIDVLKTPIYILEFEPIRSDLLNVLLANTVNFAHVGFPLFLLFYKQQIVYAESGSLTITGLNELAELAVEYYNRQSKIV